MFIEHNTEDEEEEQEGEVKVIVNTIFSYNTHIHTQDANESNNEVDMYIYLAMYGCVFYFTWYDNPGWLIIDRVITTSVASCLEKQERTKTTFSSRLALTTAAECAINRNDSSQRCFSLDGIYKR